MLLESSNYSIIYILKMSQSWEVKLPKETQLITEVEIGGYEIATGM